MTRLLGGSAGPIGWSVQFLEAGPSEVVEAMRGFPGHEGARFRRAGRYPGALEALAPLQTPWTRELVLGCGPQWTAYLNNGLHGGDPTAIGPGLSDLLGVRCVVARHYPATGDEGAGTGLEVMGPGGEPPLMGIRVVSALTEDGRYRWDEYGEPFDFEHTDRYAARRIRDRFDRALLLEYLVHLGIPAADDAAYGDGVLVQLRGRGRGRTVSLTDARAGRW